MSTIKASTPTGIFAIFSLIAVVALAAALLTIPMQVSAQSDDRDWKQSPTGLNVTAGDAAGELDITWDAHPQTSKTLPTTVSLGRPTASPSRPTTIPTGTPTPPPTSTR